MTTATLKQVKAADLKVGDVFSSGGKITSVSRYTEEGYGVEYVRTTDDGMRTCMGAHFPVECNVWICA
jgi:hypothetical protein